MIRISQIKVPIKHDESFIKSKISKKLRIPINDILNFSIYKRSLDARKLNNLHYSYTIDIEVKNEKKILETDSSLKFVEKYNYEYPVLTRISDHRPIIVGFGPAGLFTGYLLAELGLNPIILERGEDVDNRTKTVNKFWSKGILNTNSNVQFGEGGAGTFSDGKLTTRSKDLRSRKVLDILIEHGAPEEIRYLNKAHIGTDLLKGVVKSIRKKIISLGGEVHFNTYIKEFLIDNNKITGVTCDKNKSYYSDTVVLAIGHSSRDSYKELFKKGVKLEQKPFAIGLRIEHHQSLIDKNQYGDENLNELLGASDYKLSYKSSNGRSVYSFCVCPGGMVVASSSEDGGLVVNGMSEHKRDQKNINSALLVQITTEDFDSDHPLSGIEFQRKYEKKAFILGGSNYFAPVQSVGSFIRNEKNEISSVIGSYNPSTKLVDLKECLPDYVVLSLKESILNFGKKIKGFDESSAILTGVETRSSAPVRIVRQYDSMESVNIKGLYPIGEGAGYAGGIISSAIDGIKMAELIIMQK